VRDAEGGGERSEPPALPRGAKRRGDCRGGSEARSSPTRAKWDSHKRGARPNSNKDK